MSFQFLLNNSIFQFKKQVMGKPSTCRQRFADPCVWIGRERNAEHTLGCGVQKLRPSIPTFHYFFFYFALINNLIKVNFFDLLMYTRRWRSLCSIYYTWVDQRIGISCYQIAFTEGRLFCNKKNKNKRTRRFFILI